MPRSASLAIAAIDPKQPSSIDPAIMNDTTTVSTLSEGDGRQELRSTQAELQSMREMVAALQKERDEFLRAQASMQAGKGNLASSTDEDDARAPSVDDPNEGEAVKAAPMAPSQLSDHAKKSSFKNKVVKSGKLSATRKALDGRKARKAPVRPAAVPAECSICRKVLSSASGLTRHAETHKPLAQRRTWPCRKANCNKIFKESSSRTRHEALHDDNRKKFECPICLMKMNFEHNLAQHINKHRDDSVRQWVHCDVDGCEHKSIRSQNILAHKRNVHGVACGRTPVTPKVQQVRKTRGPKEAVASEQSNEEKGAKAAKPQKASKAKKGGVVKQTAAGRRKKGTANNTSGAGLDALAAAAAASAEEPAAKDGLVEVA